VDGQLRTIMKFAGTYTVFDESGQRTFQTTSVTHGLAPFLADLLDFRLLMTDQREQVLVPPPAYAFAPFYLDQDKSWSSAWEPFRNMYLPRSAATLADYHSGLKPNAYYVAQAEKDRLAVGLRNAEVRLRGLIEAVEHLRAVEPETAIYFNLEDFEAETANLLAESARLFDQQLAHRAKLSELVDTRALWLAQIQVTRAALSEFDEVFRSAAGHPIDVECPTCGEHYTNDIAARFNIAADTEALIGVLRHAQEQQGRLDKQIEAVRRDVGEIEVAISRVRAVLSTRKNDLTFEEVVAAEGRNAATRVLRERVKEVEGEIGAFGSQMDERAAEMRMSLDRKRSRTIKDFFSARFVSFAQELDVRVGDDRSASISTTTHARGSEGPRGLAAYDYAFLHTAREFGSSVFCPLVIDAPNQQGQDAQHLPAIISFLVERRPSGAQLILGVEDDDRVAAF
jgi:prefoldin subunit 5